MSLPLVGGSGNTSTIAGFEHSANEGVNGGDGTCGGSVPSAAINKGSTGGTGGQGANGLGKPGAPGKPTC